MSRAPTTRAVPAVGLLNLEAPAQVTAGETFVLSLSTGEGFPLLVNEDVAFFAAIGTSPHGRFIQVVSQLFIFLFRWQKL